MSDIFVFSGTTEGRHLSEFLDLHGIDHDVFVATEYGEIVMEASDFAHIHTGRLDENMLYDCFSKYRPRLIIDATHPYAVVVTSNIKKAVEASGIDTELIRLGRHIADVKHIADSMGDDCPRITVVRSTDEAIQYLEKTQGNILLTTGVKTLSEYTASSIKNRLIARILPSMDSLRQALDTGLMPKQIIACEGPFGVDINEAMIKQYDIKVLVTKNTGSRGGFEEKLKACGLQGTRCLVIDTDNHDEGMTFEEVQDKISSLFGDMTKPKKTIDIVGIGVANEASMTVEACQSIKSANLLIGAARMLEVGQKLNKNAKTICEYKASEIVRIVEESEQSQIVVLVSGDSTFYSGGIATSTALRRAGFTVRILPGISSISYFCAKAGVSYSDSMLISYHGVDCDISNPDNSLMLDALQTRNKVFSLVSGDDDVRAIVKLLQSRLCKGEIYIGYNLGLSDETICKYDITDDISINGEGLYVIGVVINE